MKGLYQASFFFFNDTATTEIYTLSLHDALPICLDQQHGGLALVRIGSMEGSVDLLRIVAAAAQVPDLVVAHVLDHLQRARIAAEEVLAHVGAVIGLERQIGRAHV